MEKTLTFGQKLVKGLHKVNHAVGKHSPLILTIAGVAGLGATAVLSYKASKKVEVIVEDIEEKRENEETVDRVEVAKDMAGALALPVATGVASICAIALSYHIQNNRIVNLAGALATATAEQAYYRNRYKQLHGEEAYDKFIHPTEEKKVATIDENGDPKEIIGEVKKEVPSLHGVWFDKSTEYSSDDHDYNMAFIRSVEDSMDLRLFRKGFLLMNEVNDALGLPRTRSGALLGWSATSGFGITPEVTNCLDTETGEIKPQIYIKWKQPQYIYDSMDFETARGIL